MKKDVFIIDGRNFSDLNGFYEEVTRKLVPNANWGRNLDALNDILSGGFGNIDSDKKYTIVWKKSEKSKADLSYPETVYQLKERIKTCHPSNIESIKEGIKHAENNEGSTVFDWLIEIIKGNDNITLILD